MSCILDTSFLCYFISFFNLNLNFFILIFLLLIKFFHFLNIFLIISWFCTHYTHYYFFFFVFLFYCLIISKIGLFLMETLLSIIIWINWRIILFYLLHISILVLLYFWKHILTGYFKWTFIGLIILVLVLWCFTI